MTIRTDIHRCNHCHRVCEVTDARCPKCGNWAFDEISEDICPIVREVWLIYHRIDRCYLHAVDEYSADGLVCFLSEEAARNYLEFAGEEDEWIEGFEPVKVEVDG